MGLNLINLMKDYITPEVISKASTFVGENEIGTLKAIDNIVPTILGGLLNKTEEENGLASISNLLSAGGHNGAVLNNVLNLFNGGEQTDSVIRGGSAALAAIFGDKKIADIASLISSQSDVQTSGANKLLNLITPLILGLIGKQNANGDTKDLAGLLTDQKVLIEASAPAGLAGLLGLNSLSELGGYIISNTLSGSPTAVANTTATIVPSQKKKAEYEVSFEKSFKKWLFPLLLILVAIVGLFLGIKSCEKQPAEDVVIGNDSTTIVSTETNTLAVSGKFDSLSGNWMYDLGSIIPVKLPDGTELQVGEFSTEVKLVTFLNSSETADSVKGNWFDFTNVKFKIGSSEITDESITQLKNLAAIAKAYPTAQFKVGGYTDNTGNSDANVALSKKRAETVAAQILKLGAPKTAIVGAKGYGPEWPITDNETEDGRAQNRRVSVNVKAK